VSTDSLTPRRFIATIASTTAMQTYIRNGAHWIGRKLKIASAPLAMEIEIVST
jgi:hypothetical protein